VTQSVPSLHDWPMASLQPSLPQEWFGGQPSVQLVQCSSFRSTHWPPQQSPLAQISASVQASPAPFLQTPSTHAWPVSQQ
jgi:hypothetical protein